MTKLSTKSQFIAEQLAEQIICGEIQPGARLGQNEIAAQFQSSHVPVREALRKLVEMELATSEPRRGVRVFNLTREDNEEILEMRIALESLALRQSASRLDASSIRRMEQSKAACDGASDPITWERENRNFHYALQNPCPVLRTKLTDNLPQK